MQASLPMIDTFPAANRSGGKPWMRKKGGGIAARAWVRPQVARGRRRRRRTWTTKPPAMAVQSTAPRGWQVGPTGSPRCKQRVIMVAQNSVFLVLSFNKKTATDFFAKPRLTVPPIFLKDPDNLETHVGLPKTGPRPNTRTQMSGMMRVAGPSQRCRKLGKRSQNAENSSLCVDDKCVVPRPSIPQLLLPVQVTIAVG